MFTASGLHVRFLKVFEKGNYHSIKWVRYLTKANGGYQIRVSLSVSSRHRRALMDDLRSFKFFFSILFLS